MPVKVILSSKSGIIIKNIVVIALSRLALVGSTPVKIIFLGILLSYARGLGGFKIGDKTINLKPAKITAPTWAFRFSWYELGLVFKNKGHTTIIAGVTFMRINQTRVYQSFSALIANR